MVKQGAQSDDQAHGRKIDGFHFGQANGIFPVFLTVST